LIALQKLYETVKNETAAVWAATNILKLLESLQGEQATQNTPPLDQARLVEKYTQAKKRLLLFDYGSFLHSECKLPRERRLTRSVYSDGTLTPIVKVPSAAVPSASLLSSLAALTADPRNVVYIISGRDGDFLEEHLGHIENLGMSAEHGCFLREPGVKEWTSLTDEMNLDWKKDVLQIFRCTIFHSSFLPSSQLCQRMSEE
jgi:trehalose 6-phosphate synthase/phosphatase